jgi:Flp pilus assembly protein TadD/predicted Zn-dependent protease with MMP-like domain
MSVRFRHLLFGVIAACGCKRPAADPPRAKADDAPRAAMRAPNEKGEKLQSLPSVRPPGRCFPQDSALAPARALAQLLDRAADRFDAEDFAGSLGCAEEAARGDPRSVEAHHDRAAALQELGRLDEARDAFARALALDPDDPETLAGAADLYVNRLPPSVDHSETGLEMARRGARRCKRSRDRALAARLALLEGQALNDLGRSREALSRLDAALASAQAPDDLRVKYERAAALFELCRFAEAKRGFLEVLQKTPDDAWAHHHLGLTLERLGDTAAAERELERARKLQPDDFKPPIELPPGDFRALVAGEADKLPAPLAADLRTVTLETADLPDLDDLTAEEPPLSPTILGLFRGAPIGDPTAGDGDERTIVIYRKNLARAVASKGELEEQVRTTLLHELGHLRGEDDEALRARGLE